MDALELILHRLDQQDKKLDGIETKLDDVRTEQLPKVKKDVAVLINENKHNSKLHSAIGAVAAIVISAILSAFMPHR